MPPARRAKVGSTATPAPAASLSSISTAKERATTTTTTTTTTPATRKTTRSTATRTPAIITTPAIATASSRSKTAAKSKDVNGDAEADDLVEGLGKLSIRPGAQPTTASAKRTARTTAATTSTSIPAASSSSKPSTATTARKPATTTGGPATTTTRSAAPSSRVASNGTSSKARGKAKETEEAAVIPSPLERSLPWAGHDVDVEKPLKPLERARMAMDAINTSSKSISAALASGYRHSSTSTSSTRGASSRKQSDQNGDRPSTETPTWDKQKVEELIETSQIGFKVLRGLHDQGQLPGKALDLERSCQALVTKCTAMGMYSKAMELNVASRPYLLGLYNPRTPLRNSNGDPPSTPAPANSRQKQTVSSRSTTKSALAPSVRSASASSSSSSQVPQEWLEMARMPAPVKGIAELGEHHKLVIFSAMIVTWISLVVLYSDYPEILTELTVPSSPSITDADDYLHPLVLANTLPRATAVANLHALYRQVALLSLPTSSLSYLHLRQLSFMSLSLTISSLPDSKATPAQFWDTVHRCLVGYVRDDEEKMGKLKEAARVAADVVKWVEELVALREEKGWFEGKSWISFVEMWISLGRRLGDSDIIDKPLSLLAFDTSISDKTETGTTSSISSVTPSKTTTVATKTPSSASSSLPSTPPPAPRPTTPSKATLSTSKVDRPKINNPDAVIARIFGDLAKASLALNKVLSNPSKTPFSKIEGLSSVEVILLAQAVASLPRDDEILITAGKAVRAWERVRRGCTKAYIQSLNADTSAIWAQVAGDIRGWLESSLEFFEILSESSVLDQALYRDVMAGSIDTHIAIHREDYASSLPHSRRFKALLNTARSIAKPLSQMEWCRCLSSLAYNGAVQWYKRNQNDEAMEMTRLCCDWSTEAIALYEEHQSRVDEGGKKGMVQLMEYVGKRWELLAGCYQRTGNRDDMYTAYSHCLATQAPSSLNKLASTVSFTSITESFAPLIETSGALARLTSLIMFDPMPFLGHGLQIVNTMRDANVAPEVIGAIVERLLTLLADVQWKNEGAQACSELVDALLNIYGDQYPIRRIRTIAKAMGIITASGKQAERFPSLVEEVDRLAALSDLGEDASLVTYKAEYVSYTLIYRAIQSYHTASLSSPSTQVLEASQEAVKALRSIVLPPTHHTSTSTSTPIKGGTTQDLSSGAGAGVGKRKVPLGRSTTTKAAVSSRPTRGTFRAVSEPKTGSGKVVADKATSTATATGKVKRRSSIAPVLVFDDLKKLTSLLGSLDSLLGVLGYTLQQIDVLKLLRAFQRNNEDLINDYVHRSAQLATEYQALGKTSRAGLVFQQALRVVESGKSLVLPRVRVVLLLRYACHLAAKGEIAKAQDAYLQAETLEKDVEPPTASSFFLRVVDRTETLERGAWARKALAAIYVAQDNAVGAIMQLSAAVRLFTRASDAVCRIASVYPDPTPSAISAIAADDPFGAPPPKSEPKPSGADEPSKDSQTSQPSQTTHFKGKHLYAEQWHIASSLISTTIDLATAFAYRGSVRDAEYFLKISSGVADAVRSQVLAARIGAREADLLFRLRRWEETGEKLEAAAGSLNMVEGPDMIDLNRLKGDLYSRTEMVEEAGEVFESTSKEIAGLDAVFTAAEAVIVSPRKNALLAASTNSVRASLTPSKTAQGGKEPLLPVVLAHVLRQHAWLLREAGSKEECELLLAQLRALSSSTETKAEELLLEGRIALHEAFNTFKTDLFMSSLTESAVAMPMGNPTKRIVDRQSTRLSIQTVLARAEEAFLSALSIASGSGKIEGIRQACLALALLKAFQTSLGHGSELVTASAAEILASSSSITLQRELLEAIECKFVDNVNADLKWPSNPFDLPAQVKEDGDTRQDAMEVDETEDLDLDDHDGRLRTYWDMIKTKYSTKSLISTEPPSLNTLPPEWAVISINVTDDHNTMFISRHQRDCDPIVFCLPLDRQGKREGEDEEDLWTLDAGLAEFEEIINRSNTGSRNVKNVISREDKIAWWEERWACDKKMKELCESMEFVWLGAFKTIFSPRIPSFQPIIDDFRHRVEKIFASALSSASGGGGPLGIAQPRLTSKIGGRPTKTNRASLSASEVHLEDSLLQCFARLSSKAKDEEIEDLVYFILDVYQFHGVPVALSELDIDQIAIDVKGALEKIETRMAFAGMSAPKDEHLFLALDKNVSCLPWESIPVLRGRAISRIPSLSFLLDQVAMGAHLRPSLTQSILQPQPQTQSQTQLGNGNGHISSNGEEDHMDTKRTINARRTFYILNPSGDLLQTQERFDSWLKEMVEKAGWKGIVGRPPTELELIAALKDYDLVVYIGHGGGEQYIRSHKIRHLPQCATTMLWGCSSGHLKEQGDFDRTGTAWNYMMAGCPSLTANLWDVTDADIDRLSLHVLKQTLNLDAAHLPESKSRTNTILPLSDKSITQAVNSARDECKLKYLTGAAPVTYGLPVYLH
ncbi:hypothetical protein IAT40_007199 [Kwoniella sp. CBS 6097]